MGQKRKKLWTLVFIGLLGAVMIVLTIRVGRPLLAFLSDPANMRRWVEKYYWGSRVGFMLLTALQVILAFIPGEPFEMAAGYAFGSLEGSLLCLAGITLGSVIVFSAVKKWGMKLVRIFFSQEKIDSVRIFQNPRRLKNIAFVVFLIPGTPKDILTYLVGLTPMNLADWLLICTVGRVPSLITSVVCGNAIQQQNYAQAAWVFGLTALISLAGLWAYNRMNRGK